MPTIYLALLLVVLVDKGDEDDALIGTNRNLMVPLKLGLIVTNYYY